jgi:hypothetical protein
MVKITLVFSLLVLLFGATLPVFASDTTEITIDIKPCKDPNVLNVNVIGWLPVAVHNKDVDPATVKLEGVQAEEEWFDRGDYLLFKFDAAAVIDTFGDVNNGDELTLTLTGELNDGTPIIGYDDVVILKRGKK